MAVVRDLEAEYPLSPIQQGLLFHYLSGAVPGVDLEQIVCTLHEELDAAALQRAFEDAVRRHAVLRTSFRWEDVDEPVQRVHREAPLPIEVQDWRDVPPGAQPARLDGFLHADRARGFDLREPPHPGCASPDEDTETTLCANGSDDDGDGAVDYPEAPGCSDAADDSEQSPLNACDDGLDNGGDSTPLDADETVACADGLDDDLDGLTDHPADPGCDGANDDSERSALLPCDDGLDDDGDGFADYPADPGCDDASDASEHTPALVCDDGLDNDADLVIDSPADTGCSWLLDATETAEPPPPPPGCGVGPELALLLPWLDALRRRRKRSQ